MSRPDGSRDEGRKAAGMRAGGNVGRRTGLSVSWSRSKRASRVMDLGKVSRPGHGAYEEVALAGYGGEPVRCPSGLLPNTRGSRDDATRPPDCRASRQPWRGGRACGRAARGAPTASSEERIRYGMSRTSRRRSQPVSRVGASEGALREGFPPPPNPPPRATSCRRSG